MIILDRERCRIAERRQVAPAYVSANGPNPKSMGRSYYVRVAQTEVSRERAHVALPAVATKSSPGRGDATVAGRQIRRRDGEVVVPRWGFGFDPAETSRLTFGGGDVAAAHGQRGRCRRRVLDDDDFGNVWREMRMNVGKRGDL